MLVRRVGWPTSEPAEPRIQPAEDGPRTKDTDAGRRQLDRQWQAVQSGADRGDVSGLVGRELEVGPDRAGAVDEQANRRQFEDLVEVRLGFGHDERLDAVLVLNGEMESARPVARIVR